jgi:ketoreductase RED2
MGEFTGQVALVTGSMSGMGEAIAARLAAEGATVVLNSRTTPNSPIRFPGFTEDAMHVACDVSDENAVIKMIAEIEARYGALDILINNAGTTVVIPHDDLQGATNEIWNRILGVNIIGPWNTIKAAEHLLRKSKLGSVVNISSIGGFRPALGSSVPYSVSKAGLNQLTQLLARSLGPDIRVNAIAPGFIETPWTSGEKWAERQKHVQDKSPLRRTGSPADIAEACLGLIRSEYVTGAVLSVDGGLSLL